MFVVLMTPTTLIGGHLRVRMVAKAFSRRVCVCGVLVCARPRCAAGVLCALVWVGGGCCCRIWCLWLVVFVVAGGTFTFYRANSLPFLDNFHSDLHANHTTFASIHTLCAQLYHRTHTREKDETRLMATDDHDELLRRSQRCYD